MLSIILGIFIGLIAGVVQFYLLFKFVRSVTGGKFSNKTVLFAITQFLFPFAILVICAFLLPDSLMWVGIGMASALIGCAIVRFVFAPKFEKNTDKKK